MKKKILALSLVAIFAFSFAACDFAEKDSNAKAKNVTNTESEHTTTESQTTTEETTTEETTTQAPANDNEYINQVVSNGGATNQAIIPGTGSQNVHVSETVEGEIAWVINNYTNGSMSAFEKCKAVHDYLVSTVVYDGSDQVACHEAEGALVQHRAVCDGYSKAFMLIMQRLGYPCQLVYGYANENHAWNVVCLDGVWYQMDVTWDDPLINGANVYDGSNVCYTYFLLNDANMYASHQVYPQWNPDGVPVCSSTAGMDWINNSFLRTHQPNAVVNNIASAVDNAVAFSDARYGTFYILYDANYVGNMEATFNEFYNAYAARIQTGHGVASVNLGGRMDSGYLIIECVQTYW